MLSSLSQLSFDNEARIRRQIISISVVLLVFKNLELASDKLTLLSLEIIISKPAIVSATTIVLIAALIAFVFAFAEKFPRRYAHYKRRADDKWWEPISNEIDDFHKSSDPNYEFEQLQEEERHQNRDWDDDAYDDKYMRAQKRRKILNWYRPINTVTRSVSNFIWPISIAIIALFCPEVALIFTPTQ